MLAACKAISDCMHRHFREVVRLSARSGARMECGPRSTGMLDSSREARGIKSCTGLYGVPNGVRLVFLKAAIPKHFVSVGKEKEGISMVCQVMHVLQNLLLEA